METKNFRIRIMKGDQQLELEGNQDFIIRMLERFGVAQQIFFSQNSLIIAEDHTNYAVSQISPFEFIRSIDFQKKSDIALGFAYYLEKYSSKTEFSLADIKNLFYESRLELTNLAPILSQHVKRRYIIEVKTRGSKTKRVYRMTRAGEEHIEKVLKR